MAQSIVEKWNSLTLVQKVLLIVGLPVAVLLAFTQFGRSILAFLEQKTRAKVDERSDALDKKIKSQETEANRAEGRLEQLEKEKADAIQKAKNDNPQQAVDFWNSRPDPSDK